MNLIHLDMTRNIVSVYAGHVCLEIIVNSAQPVWMVNVQVPIESGPIVPSFMFTFTQ